MTSEPSPQTGVGKGSQADFMAQMTFASMGSSCTDPSCTDSFCGRPSGVREAKETSFRRSRGNFFTKLFDGGRREVDDEDLGLGLLEKGGGEDGPRSTISSLTLSFTSSPSLTSLQDKASSEACRRRVALSVVCIAAFSLFIWLVTVLMDEGRTVAGRNVPTDKIDLATWNILCLEDEYSESWGCPLQISLCGDDRGACTEARRRRVWGVIEGLGVDALALQEVEDEFLDLQPAGSKWTVAARSGQCAVLFPVDSGFKVVGTGNVTIGGLTGCPSAPYVVLESLSSGSLAAVASVHVGASSSLPNFSAGFVSAFEDKVEGLVGDKATLVAAGDYNHNATSALSPEGWSVSHPSSALAGGTSQHQDDWMGR